MDIPVETSFSDFVHRLHTLVDDPALAAIYAAEYLTAHDGEFPIIEGNTAHFIYKERPGTVVGIGGDWNGWNGRNAYMTPIGGGLLHYQHDFELDARLDYLFYEIEADNLQASLSGSQTRRHSEIRALRDPLNSLSGKSAFGTISELAMPGYRQAAITQEQPGVIAGRAYQEIIKSKILGQDRPYTIFLPPNFDSSAEPYPAIYFQDGGDYLSMGNAPTILNNLIDLGAIPPVVAVFVPPVQRGIEYNCDDQYVRFFCDELVPKLQGQYNLSSDPAKRAVFGPSLGGLISLYVGSQRSDVFGLVGAQSSAIHSINGIDKYDARKAYTVQARLPLRLHLVVGTYEDCFSTDAKGRCQDLLNPVRDFHAVIGQAGYSHRYAEYHQGHSWGLWRDCLADALIYFFGEG